MVQEAGFPLLRHLKEQIALLEEALLAVEFREFIVAPLLLEGGKSIGDRVGLALEDFLGARSFQTFALLRGQLALTDRVQGEFGGLHRGFEGAFESPDDAACDPFGRQFRLGIVS